MKKRILTLVVELDQLNKPEWIWDSHRLNSFMNGIYVHSIGEGDQTVDLDNACDSCDCHKCLGL